jgi:hypothetical protein
MNPQNAAQGLAGLGRYGDSTLVHMQPREVAGLQALAQANGTSLSTNPDTGLPEAFDLGGVLEAAIPIAAGAFLGPAGAGIGGGFFTGANAALMSGLTVGALTTALSGGDLGKGLMSGLGAYGGAGLGGNLASAGKGVTDSVQQTALNNEMAMKAAGSIPTQSAMTSNVVGQGGMNIGQSFTDDILAGGMPNANIGSNLTGQGAGAGVYTDTNLGANMGQVIRPESGFQNAMTGARNLTTPEGWNAFKAAGGSGGQLAMLGGSALLGGVEEKDIYGKPIKPQLDTYDPYATLNLGGPSSKGESGLRLLASGGPVSFAKGGASMKGGGSGAMEGATPITVSVSGGSSAGNYPAARFMGGIGQSIQPSQLGLFADQSRIDEVRAEQAAAQRRLGNFGLGALSGFGMSNLGGMGGMNQPYMGMGGMNQPYMGMGGMGQAYQPRNAAPVESIDHLNLGKHNSLRLATGGTIQGGGNMDLYGTSDNLVNPPISQDGYGVGRLDRLARTSADASAGQYQFKDGGYLDGAGDGMSDSIPATIEGKQPARLADGEFVIPADVVSHLGNGSTKAGAKQLYKMLDKIRSARTGTKKQGKQINPNKFMPA